jgi:glycosyltransferase involved in cell wall biosynthesis
MNILYVANIRLPTERAHGVQIMKACEAFAAAGSAVELLVPRRWSPITEEPFAYYGVKSIFSVHRAGSHDLVQRWGFIGYWVQSLSFVLAARKHVRMGADIVYCRDEHMLFILALLGVKRLVWESHDGAWNFAARFIARRVSHIVVTSRGARDFYTARGVPESRILAVPNGIDLDAFAKPESSETARRRLGISDKRVVMYVGSLEGWKGVETLFEAARALSDDIRFVVIGGGEKELPRLRERHPRVLFLGERPYRELADNLAAADVCVLPNTAKDTVSLLYTSPLKLFAYMAAGKPIVASDIPSIREIAGDTALFVPPDDPRALAAGIQELFDNPDRAHQLAAAARERVQAFSWDARARAILDFLR